MMRLTRDTAVGRVLGEVTDGVRVMRAPLLAGLLTIFALSYPEQLRELYRILAQERITNVWPPHWLFALASLLALSLTLWQTARELAFADRSPDNEPPRLTRQVLEWLPRVLAILPLLGAAVGILLSRSPTSIEGVAPQAIKQVFDSLEQGKFDLGLASALCLLLAIALFALITAFERWMGRSERKGERGLLVFNNWLLFPSIVAVSIVLFASDPVGWPQYFGAIPIFAFWVASIAVIGALLTRVLDRFGIPLLTIAIACVVVFGILDRNDNHRFRWLDGEVARPDVESAFPQWLGSRADAQAYKDAGKPYPVYIVAAEGGGLYAAYHTAKFLARMQELCPNFAQHVFAISSVSGGGLGSAVFAGLAQSHVRNSEASPCLASPPKERPLEAYVDGILSQDFLSPLVWAGLFPDFIQRLLPFSVPSFDRGLALERSLEEAWERGYRGAGNNPMKSSMFDLCGPGSATCAGATPALLFNLTNVETGFPMVLSPMYVSYVGHPYSKTGTLFDFTPFSDRIKHMRLSTAAVLSARFPWITPQGWQMFPEPNPPPDDKLAERRMSFVDGGYNDNSGVETAIKVAQYLEYLASRDPQLPKFAIKLISIAATYKPFDRFMTTKADNSGYGEVSLPLVSAYRAWQARSWLAHNDALPETKPGIFDIAEAEFYYYLLPLPLGWQLSKTSRDYIDLFNGNPSQCDQAARSGRSNRDDATKAASYVNLNNCIAADITSDLTPSAPLAVRAKGR